VPKQIIVAASLACRAEINEGGVEAFDLVRAVAAATWFPCLAETIFPKVRPGGTPEPARETSAHGRAGYALPRIACHYLAKQKINARAVGT